MGYLSRLKKNINENQFILKRYRRKHPFNITLTLVAIVVSIIFLVIVGVKFYLNRYNITFPPVIADCPDYWLDESDDDTIKCVNVKNIGKEGCPKTMNFSDSRFKGNNGLCRKYKWAKRCDITWDGISQLEDTCS